MGFLGYYKHCFKNQLGLKKKKKAKKTVSKPAVFTLCFHLKNCRLQITSQARVATVVFQIKISSVASTTLKLSIGKK